MCQYPLFETIAIINGEIQQLAYHQQRLNFAFQHYLNCANPFNLRELINIPQLYQQGVIRCRIDYNQFDYQINFYPYQPKKIDCFRCVYQTDLDYQFKYSDRRIFETFQLAKNQEIIIINNGFVSDCSIGNLLFAKQNKWYSPRHYLLKGTQLSYLLDQKQVELVDITVDDLFEYQQIMWINALNPFALNRALPITSGTIFK